MPWIVFERNSISNIDTMQLSFMIWLKISQLEINRNILNEEGIDLFIITCGEN